MATTLSQEEAIFLAALEIGASDQRSAYLDAACGGHADLRCRIAALLSRSADAAGPLDRPAVSRAAPTNETPTEEPGSVIGPYKLLEQVGEGGMGVVFVAEQSEPVRRRVALKVIKPGMDTKEVVARFEAERQALALMDHPNIAQVFDAGTTATGRPYFVMELFRGLPITDYCDQARLTTAGRLRLFVKVCRAVQHAHQKGIIHRDLKPNNILVTLHDGEPVPKVIDFGVAKAVNQRLSDKTVYTRLAQLVGTPLYMSPEQAEMSGLDVDTRSDVYSLGVLLYELLTGTTPFEPETLKQVGFDEMRRLIREEQPPRPSRRLNTLDARACSTVSERRGVDGRQLGQLMRGELDWVVMRALEKDRNRRYESASALATDVERYLADEPVEAGPPSAVYRLRKFVRRQRRLLAVAGLFAVVLMAATAVSTWLAVKARGAERRATTEAAIAKAVNDFLQQDLLRQVDIQVQEEDGFEVDPNLTVKEALNRAAARIGDRFQDQPLVEAAIRATIGSAYHEVGEFEPAATHLEWALALRQRHLGSIHPDTLSSVNRLATTYLVLGRRLDAIALHEKLAEKQQSLLGPDHYITLDTMLALAKDYGRAKLWNKSLLMLEQVVAKRTTLLGSNHPETIQSLDALAKLYSYLGRLDESLTLFQKTLDLHKSIPGRHQNSTFGLLLGYARACVMAEEFDQAERLAHEAIQSSQQRSGSRSRLNTGNAMSHLGLILLRQKRFAEAESVARESQTIFEDYPVAFIGINNQSRFNAMSVVGGALLGQKKYAEAEPLLVQGYEGLKQREAVITISFESWLSDALERVIQFYEATDQPEKARVWREKRSRTHAPGPG